MLAGMAPKPVFIIRAWYADRATGAFDMAAETKEAALQKARRLSDQVSQSRSPDQMARSSPAAQRSALVDRVIGVLRDPIASYSGRVAYALLLLRFHCRGRACRRSHRA